jgi:hypothetical protein
MTTGRRVTDAAPLSTATSVIALNAATGQAQPFPVDNFGAQLVTTGPVSEQLAAIRSQVTSGLLAPATWADLSAITGSTDAAGAEVPLSDTGTHAQATATGYDGETVDNAGRYSWSAAWSRWVRIGEYGGAVSDVILTAAGTGDAIAATSDRDYSQAAYEAKFVMQVAADNTGPVTVAIDGGAAYELRTNTGAALEAGELLAGMAIEWRWNGSEYRLIPGITVAAMVQRAEDARDAAEFSAGAALASEGNASDSEDAAALSEANAAASEVAAASSASASATARTQSELAALAAGASIVTTLTSPVPADGTIELLQIGPGTQVNQVVTGAWSAIGWLGEVLYDDAAAVLSSADTGFAVGQIIRSREGGHGYKTAAAPATDHHWTTPGGVKLYFLRDELGLFSAQALGYNDGDQIDDLVELVNTIASLDYEKPVYLNLGVGSYTLGDSTRHSLNVNLRIGSYVKGRLGRCILEYTHASAGFTIARPATLPGGLTQNEWWASTISGFDGIVFRAATGVTVEKFVEIQSIVGFTTRECLFDGSSGGGATIGVRQVNTLSRWCELWRYYSTVWNACDTNIQFDVDGGTNSHGHGRMETCHMGIKTGGKGCEILNGASPYDANWNLVVFHEANSALFYLNGGTLSYGQHLATYEVRASGGYYIQSVNSSSVRFNSGSVTFAATGVRAYDDDGSGIYGRSNSELNFVGSNWDRGDGTDFTGGNNLVTSLRGADPAYVTPKFVRTVTCKAAGVAAQGARVDVIPRAETGDNYQWRIWKAEILVGTPSSGNADGYWYFDVTRTPGSLSPALGLTSLRIADGATYATVMIDAALGAANWYDFIQGVWSKAVVADVLNNGTGPSDPVVILYIV